MQNISITSLIFDDLTYAVPSTIEEYNALAPKRVNPILEDAIDNIIKHKVLSQFRNQFLDKVEEQFKIARINNGTEKTPKWEPDMPYMNRVVATVLEQRGQKASDPAAVKAFADELRATAQAILNGIKFNVAEREPSTAGPTVGKQVRSWAEAAMQKGNEFVTKLLDHLNKANNAQYAFVGDVNTDTDTLAKALAQNEKRKRDEATAAANAEYGLAVE